MSKQGLEDTLDMKNGKRFLTNGPVALAVGGNSAGQGMPEGDED